MYCLYKECKFDLIKIHRKVDISLLTSIPFTSCLLPRCQDESSCETIHIHQFRLQVNFHANLTHFPMKGFTGALVKKQRH